MPIGRYSGVLLCLLMSSAYSKALSLSVSQHGPRLFIAKSWGLPVKLTCEDHRTGRIDVNDISLFKSKRTVPADGVFPGIKAKSQSECQSTFSAARGKHPAECELRFQGKVLPSDVMVVAVYRCFAPSQSPSEIVHTRASEKGDVELRCEFGNIIDILDVKLNKSEFGEGDKEITKQLCSMKMFQAQLPDHRQSPSSRKPAVCAVSRQGRTGELMVKYQCLPAPQKDSGLVATKKAPQKDSGLVATKQAPQKDSGLVATQVATKQAPQKNSGLVATKQAPQKDSGLVTTKKAGKILQQRHIRSHHAHHAHDKQGAPSGHPLKERVSKL